MGFPWGAVKVPAIFSTESLATLVSFFRFMLTAALTRLGLLKRQQEHDYAEEDNPGYVLIMDGMCPLPIPIPVDVLTAMIKKKLPVIEYAKFLRKFGDGDKVKSCPVCLHCMKERDEVRVLCNCSHVFHRECLDGWLDVHQVNCPICRSVLYPQNLGSLRPGDQDPWVVMDRD